MFLYFWKQFEEQKDQVSVEQILRVVFLDPEHPSPVSTWICVLIYFVPKYLLDIRICYLNVHAYKLLACIVLN